jgi:nicotinate phosphoribosyltransferase
MQNGPPDAADPFAAKRAAMREEFYRKLFLLGGWLGGTDTYKRTMWAAVPDVATARAGYALTMRHGLDLEKELGLGEGLIGDAELRRHLGTPNQLIMAGHEAMLAQWFHRPLRRSDIELARRWFTERAAARAFPDEVWDAVVREQPGEDVYLPVDVWGFAGGQAFLPGVPCLFFEGMGGVVSYLEPAMCRYFAPVIQATKARVMRLVSGHGDAEFGLRAAPTEVSNIILLLARYVGSGGQARLTSNDTAEFLYPELFRSIGTIGHEMMCAAQSFDRSLGEAEYEMMERFVRAMKAGRVGVKQVSILTDLVDAETVGLENALRVLDAHRSEMNRIGVRVDSGDIEKQCALYFARMRAEGRKPDGVMIVFESEVTPRMIRQVYNSFCREHGETCRWPVPEPLVLFPGEGGYWWQGVSRDALAAAFKRSATGGHPNVKFSNTPGKESLPGYLRVYGRGEALVVADASEPPPGEPLFVNLVANGRIVYRESFEQQAARADRTWCRYTRVELSEKVHGYMERFRAMRDREVAASRQRLARK